MCSEFSAYVFTVRESITRPDLSSNDRAMAFHDILGFSALVVRKPTESVAESGSKTRDTWYNAISVDPEEQLYCLPFRFASDRLVIQSTLFGVARPTKIYPRITRTHSEPKGVLQRQKAQTSQI